MTDPRYSDSRHDPQFSDPVSRRSNNIWGWFAGIVVVALVLFLVLAGHQTGKQTASNPPPATTGSATQTMPPAASTTGQGMATPMTPHTPAPSGKPVPSTK